MGPRIIIEMDYWTLFQKSLQDILANLFKNSSPCSVNISIQNRYCLPWYFLKIIECVLTVLLVRKVLTNNKAILCYFADDSPSPKERPRKGQTKTIIIIIVLVFAATILLFAANIAVRKLVSSRRVKAAEKADFEFRDYDALSVSSGNTVCSSRFKLWSIQKSLETAPFCKESRLYTF